MSARIEADRAALESDRARLSAEAAELEAERQRIDAAWAALRAVPDPEREAVLSRQEATFNARLQAARRAEKALQRRTDDLNSRILGYNDRVRSARRP